MESATCLARCPDCLGSTKESVKHVLQEKDGSHTLPDSVSEHRERHHLATRCPHKFEQIRQNVARRTRVGRRAPILIFFGCKGLMSFLLFVSLKFLMTKGFLGEACHKSMAQP